MFPDTAVTLLTTFGISMALFFVLISEILKVIYVILFV